MALIPLTEVQAQIRCGVPLLWDVVSERAQRLLAKGHIIASQSALEALLARDTYVDSDDVHVPAVVEPAPDTTFFGQWRQLEASLGLLLRNFQGAPSLEKLKQAARSLTALVDQDNDQAVFSVVRHDHSRFAAYGASHSMHVAAMCGLLSERMGWPAERRASLVGAALTMNLSTIELQGTLATRGGPLTPNQKALIHCHPDDSARLLEAAGLTDREWLGAVRDHHETPEGSGYPKAKTTPSELSQVIRIVDIFTAKHASRCDRAPVSVRQAAQDLYRQHPTQPTAALLIKEFGMYPPGCFVKLASGETAVALRNGPSALAPQVAILQENVPHPLLRDTSEPAYKVTAVISDRDVMLKCDFAGLFTPAETVTAA